MTHFHKNRRVFKLALITVLLGVPLSGSLLAQEEERWFTIEVSIFSNEGVADRYEEQWQPGRTEMGYPANMRRLDELMDLLLTDELQLVRTDAEDDQFEQFGAAIEAAIEPTAAENRTAALLSTGPRPLKNGGDFKFYDLQRDSFVNLPPTLSDFQQTNQALDRSVDHRLLFQGLWHQVVPAQDAATPIYIQGGLQYGNQHELQGSLSIRFNANQDRVVVDANLWLAEFSVIVGPDTKWSLPPVPAGFGKPQLSEALDQLNQSGELTLGPQQPTYFASRVFHMQQSRDMRSAEFHYMDHPALGLVIIVQPYEVPQIEEPEIPLPEFNFEPDQ